MPSELNSVTKAVAKFSTPGVLLIDKPAGITSAGVLRALKHRVDKLGHAGTLDPAATGLLVVLLNKATRLQHLFQNSSKKYSGLIRLGIETDTDDLQGVVVRSCQGIAEVLSQRTEQDWLDLIKKEFTGGSQQVPPQYSAIKVDGVRSYKRAREGERIELSSREIDIQFSKLEFVSSTELSYEVECSKGTYIRSLARDIGKLLGVGGCLATICRIASGPFSLSQAISIEQARSYNLEDVLFPIHSLIGELEKITLSEDELASLRLGQQKFLEDLKYSGAQPQLAILNSSGDFMGLLNLQPERGWRVGFLM